MADRRYFVLRNRVEAKLEKPRAVIPHMVLFAAYTIIFGGMSIILSPFDGAMDGIFYWTIFGWSVLVGLHTTYAYMRSGAWAATRDRLIQSEILEADSTLDLSEEEMINLHTRLSDEISTNAAPFRRLAATAAGYVAIWPGMLILIFALQRLVNYDYLNGNPTIDALFAVWQPLSLLFTLVVTLTLFPWQQLIPKAKSQEDLRTVYSREKRKRHEDAGLSLTDDIRDTAESDDEEGRDDAALHLRKRQQSQS